jgi:serine-type D-Ala-D-Ala carboxypeptidase/endopeptidase (penicillin-binding protein 4)
MPLFSAFSYPSLTGFFTKRSMHLFTVMRKHLPRSCAVLVALSFLGMASSAYAAGDAQALPANVAAALARAGVPRDAVSMMVQAILSSPTSSRTTGTATLAEPAARLAHRSQTPMNPASVMKLVTTYSALNTLGPNFTWTNRVYTDGQLLGDGVLQGNLILRGSGDPKLVLERIQDLFAQIQAKGVREVRGDIILDRSIFTVPDKNPADFDDEPLRPYNAVPDGFLVNFKSLIFKFIPDEANQRVIVQSEPPIAGVAIPASVPMVSGGCGDWRSALRADFFTPTKINFSGRYAASCGERTWPVAYSQPRAYAARVIDAMWLASGGSLTGSVHEGNVPRGARALLSAPSLPLSAIIADVNKFSNNVMAQQVFLTMSAQHGTGSFAASRQQLANWWQKTLPTQSAPIMENGSGLSRKERISAQSLTALLHHAAGSPQASVFASSLGLAGVDGTVAKLRDRRPDSIALGNAQLKTGTLNDVAALAGYATGRSGQRYSVVGIINHPNAESARTALDLLVEWTIEDTP